MVIGNCFMIKLYWNIDCVFCNSAFEIYGTSPYIE